MAEKRRLKVCAALFFLIRPPNSSVLCTEAFLRFSCAGIHIRHLVFDFAEIHDRNKWQAWVIQGAWKKRRWQ